MLTPKDEIQIATEEIKLKIKARFGEIPNMIKWAVVIFVVGIVPAYIISKNISASLWSKDHRQFALTAKPSFSNPQTVNILKTFIAQTGPGVYAAAVEIQNQNLNLLIKDTPYTFNLYNAKNQLLDSEQGTLFLLPNQTDYIVLPRYQSQDPITRAELILPQNLNWKKPAQLPQVQLLTSLPYVHTQSSPPGLAVESSVLNNSPYNLNQVRLVFLIFGQTGSIVSISQRSEFTIAPGERRGFKQLFPDLNSPTGLNVQIFAYTNTADNANISAPPLPANVPSNLGQ